MPGRHFLRASAAAGVISVSARHRAFGGPDAVGGDFSARCETEYGTRLILGDVRGKGEAAATKADFLTSAFLLVAASRPRLEEVSTALDSLAAADAGAEWDPAAREWFATAVIVQVEPDGRGASILNHGHPAPLLVRPGRVRELPPSRSRLPLGLGHLAPVGGSPDRVRLGLDSSLVLFTDGVSEARDPRGRMFDPVTWLRSLRGADQSGLLDRLLAEVDRHVEGAWRDDLAAVTVQRGAETGTATAFR